MKRAYNKPYARKVEFSYEDQVVVASGYHSGGISNRDDTKTCQFWGACNVYWNVASTSTYSLNDCKTDDFPTGG